MMVVQSLIIFVGCIGNTVICGMIDDIITPSLYSRGEHIAVIHYKNEYKIVSADTHEALQTYYTIEHDSITPIAHGYERTIVATRPGEYTLLGIPVYRHELTITETHAKDSHMRTIKTRFVHENTSLAILAIVTLGLAGIMYKIAQKVQENYSAQVT
ncbi:MAG: hypothetical protein ACHQVS_01650 [Candidatus Babeliales bacterium]